MICPNCNTNNPETNNYCPICGTKLKIEIEAPEISEDPAAFRAYDPDLEDTIVLEPYFPDDEEYEVREPKVSMDNAGWNSVSSGNDESGADAAPAADAKDDDYVMTEDEFLREYLSGKTSKDYAEEEEKDIGKEYTNVLYTDEELWAELEKGRKTDTGLGLQRDVESDIGQNTVSQNTGLGLQLDEINDNEPDAGLSSKATTGLNIEPDAGTDLGMGLEAGLNNGPEAGQNKGTDEGPDERQGGRPIELEDDGPGKAFVVLEQLSDNLKDGLSNAKDKLGIAKDKLGNATKEGLGNVKDGLGNAKDKLGGAKDGLDSAKDKMGVAKDKLGNATKDGLENVKGGLGNVKEGLGNVKDGLGSVKDKISNIDLNTDDENLKKYVKYGLILLLILLLIFIGIKVFGGNDKSDGGQTDPGAETTQEDGQAQDETGEEAGDTEQAEEETPVVEEVIKAAGLKRLAYDINYSQSNDIEGAGVDFLIKIQNSNDYAVKAVTFQYYQNDKAVTNASDDSDKFYAYGYIAPDSTGYMYCRMHVPSGTNKTKGKIKLKGMYKVDLGDYKIPSGTVEERHVDGGKDYYDVEIQNDNDTEVSANSKVIVVCEGRDNAKYPLADSWGCGDLTEVIAAGDSAYLKNVIKNPGMSHYGENNKPVALVFDRTALGVDAEE